MTRTALAQNAYAATSKNTGAPRAVEHQIFSRITGMLTAADDGAEGSFPALARALHENGLLWSVIASDVSGEGNALGAPLRAQLFYLAQFTRTHTAKVLAGEASAAPLIEINTAIMRGLRGQSGPHTPDSHTPIPNPGITDPGAADPHILAPS